MQRGEEEEEGGVAWRKVGEWVRQDSAEQKVACRVRPT